MVCLVCGCVALRLAALQMGVAVSLSAFVNCFSDFQFSRPGMELLKKLILV
jgi:hypothetical protein